MKANRVLPRLGDTQGLGDSKEEGGVMHQDDLTEVEEDKSEAE